MKYCYTTDLFIARNFNSLQNLMVGTPGWNQQPVFTFDMCFFYKCIFLGRVSYFGADVKIPDFPHRRNKGANFPDLRDPRWQESYFFESGLADHVFDSVRRESVADGEPFDLSFVCEVGRRIYSQEKVEWIRDGIGKTFKRIEPGSDEWWQMWCGEEVEEVEEDPNS
jgi:hypothetical protein